MELTETANEITPHENRTVIVVGKSGSGKSTVANKILGHEAFSVSSSLDGETKKADKGEATHTVMNVDTKQKYDYNFKLIDTVGFFDAEIRNEDVMNEIKDYMKKEAPEGANLILFVFKNGRFSPEEKDTFDYIIKNFKNEIAFISALVITNCDGKSDRAREKIIKDFTKSQRSGKIAAFMWKGLFAVGFPDTSEMEEDAVSERTIQKMEEDAKKLRQLVMKAECKLSGEVMFANDFWEKVRGMCIIL